MSENATVAMLRDEKQLVSFHLSDEEFGANIMNVREIVRVPDITLTPNAPHYIEGICNLRGNVLPIMDGRARFNLPHSERNENNRVLVIDINGETTGIIVDRVSEVLTIQTTDIEPPPSVISGISADYLDGVVKLNQGQRLILDLDLSKVFNLEVNQVVEMGPTHQEASRQSEAGAKELIDEKQLVSFAVGEEEYGIDIMRVKEIIRVPDIAHLPKAPLGVEGMVSIRNKLLPILNLRQLFGMPEAEMTDATRILVVDMGGLSAGIKVDRVSEVMRIPAHIVDETPAMMVGEGGEQIQGVAKLDNGERLILILDPERLLSQQDLKSMSKQTTGREEENAAGKLLIDEEQLVTFKLGPEEFAININAVQEINRMTEITRVPGAPSYMEGLVNLRGNVIPALDLRKRFGMEHEEWTDATRVIIVDLEGLKTGIIVDSVSEVLRLEKGAIDPPPEVISTELDAAFVEGVGKLNNGQRMVMILDLAEIVSLKAKASVEDSVSPEPKKAAAKKTAAKSRS